MGRSGSDQFRTSTLNKTYSRSGIWLLLLLVPGCGAFAPEARAAGPEPAGWYAGDMHVHRSCGGSPASIQSIYDAMVGADLSVVSLLADMGNGEVQDPTTDLARVNGQDDPVSSAGRLVHWDAEWHWDATYTQYPHQALGGHVVCLGLTNAYQIWSEYTFPILDWAHRQGGIAGFAHLQYLDDTFPQTLNCCIPIEYPVEVALGACDFISEDVTGSESAILAYYRLLNCGFRPGFAAGSDSPCGSSIGPLLTYVQVVGGQMTYSNWIRGIAGGRTVVSRNGRNEFLELKVNGSATPGDEVQLSGSGSVSVTARWTATQNLTGTIELVCNGEVVASQQASVSSGTPATLSTTVSFAKSGWLCARRTSGRGHEVHTGAVFVKVNNAPIRASVTDAQFYVEWMDNLLLNTSPGGGWSSFFVNSRAEAQGRYSAARSVFQQIAVEAGSNQPSFELAIATSSLPVGMVNQGYSATLMATGGITPYAWSLADGSLPPGLALGPSSGTISGTPVTPGTSSFRVRVSDSSSPVQAATQALAITIMAPPALVSIWPDAAVPGVVDRGPDNSVELGLKFRSDVAGMITGVRFYKASANTGTHVGSLWTGSGTRLATVTFTNESASGWQQVLFASPVAIASNTVYVVSYHPVNGHYSQDLNYFSSGGTDRPPLHALADGVSGGNGVYRYNPGNVFPNKSGNGANYWVDVVFQPAASQTLTSIALAPANPIILTGALQQFTANGVYSDNRTQDITGQAGWISSNAAVATVSSSGLARALAPGTTTIAATLAGVTGSTSLTVQGPPQLLLAGHDWFSGTNVLTLAWSNSGILFELEGSGRLTGAWSTIITPRTTNAQWVSTTLTNTASAQFFRLRGN